MGFFTIVTHQEKVWRMTLSAMVYKKRSLTEEERAVINWYEPETGEPIVTLEADSFIFTAREMWLGNISGIAELRWELERSFPRESEALRQFVVASGSAGLNVTEPDISRIVAECSNLLTDERFHLSEYLRRFLTEFLEIARVALHEQNPIVIL